MKNTETLKGSKGLLGEGLAAVIGMPQPFDLARRLSESSHVRLITAFAHLSGWKLISAAVAACKGQVDILVGLHFFQTEPKLLRTWLRNSYQSDKFTCRVVTRARATGWTFHPKVLIVSGTQSGDFAVVGSGNLSAGGFRNNVECSLFTDDQKLVSDLCTWFEEISETFTVKLEESVIRRYEPLYKKYQSRLRELTKHESNDLRKIDKEVAATLRHWDKAVSDAKAYFESAKFMEQWKESRNAISKIRMSLDYPRFSVTPDGLKEFFGIKEFGNLGPIWIHKQELLRKLDKIGSAFGILINDNREPLARFEEVISGKSKVKFMSMNVLTKVLAAHDEKKWPVYNSKVEGVLRRYGYEIPRGLTPAEKYLAYARLMRKFAAETDAKDVYALDRFFLLEVELSHNYPQVSGPLPSSYLVAALRNAGRYLHLPSHAEAACLP